MIQLEAEVPSVRYPSGRVHSPLREAHAILTLEAQPPLTTVCAQCLFSLENYNGGSNRSMKRSQASRARGRSLKRDPRTKR